MNRMLVVLLIVALAIGSAFAQGKAKSQQSAPQVVSTKDAPPPAGPYSQAIAAGGFVYVAGQIARDPATAKMVEGDVAAQTDRVMKNIAAVLAAAGSSMDKVIRTTVYLKSVSDFSKMNQVYGSYFKTHPPARSTVGGDLPVPGSLVEIDAIALK
jgi:2-iminobutanoate/2-iminopropanoate deaminase